MHEVEPQGEARIGSRDARREPVFANLTLRTEGGNCSVVVHDLSATGARVEARSSRFEVGHRVELQLPLLPDDRSGEIVWSAGTSAGIKFDIRLDEMTVVLLSHAMRPVAANIGKGLSPAPNEVNAPSDQQPQPRAKRAEVAIGANCRTASGRRGFVAMIDLAPQGCCLFAPDLVLAPGQSLRLEPECLAALNAKVQWSEGSLAGVSFEHPLYPPVFDHLAVVYPWALSESAKLALRREMPMSDAAQRELQIMSERAQQAFKSRHGPLDILAARPASGGSRFGPAAQAIGVKLSNMFVG